jgi:hypothetical protein
MKERIYALSREAAAAGRERDALKVGRRRLTLSNPL